MTAPPLPRAEWLTLTDLGRLYGISAVLCGRLLGQAGLRHSDGSPSRLALHRSLTLPAPSGGHQRSALWHRRGCGVVLEQQGLKPMNQQRLIQQWADLLEALLKGAAAVTTSAQEMAGEVPEDLVGSVNHELRQRGSRFQVRGPGLTRGQPRRRASACRAARSSSSCS